VSVTTQRDVDAHTYLTRMQYFTKPSRLGSIMSEQPIEHSLVKIELLRNTLLRCVTPNSNVH
jgi:hypothetical protein